MLIGHEKGDDTTSRLKHNFGMARPEGYRKAIRLMELADRFGLPVVTLVDTPGAFPGVQAEERGQAEAIARSTEACLALKTPLVAAVVGEGGSGGAVALASAERVLMLEHAVYSVISPEGYRKAIRLMELAGRFGLPVVTLVDTSGAYPGVEAEERGQAEAIARSTEACLGLPVPMVAAIVGEGGSGGAVALASAERVLMFEHAVYSVIPPEGCAGILWRTAEKAAQAAEAMKMTAQDLEQLGVIDRIVAEPAGGAHRDPQAAAVALGAALGEELDALAGKSAKQLRRQREDRFLAIGQPRKARGRR
jgi:acetyl-CoA carboxylase alpha subunit